MWPDKKKKEKVKGVPYYKLYRFANGLDRFLILLGIIASMGTGVMQPLSLVVFGDMIDAFAPGANLIDSIHLACAQMAVLGAISFCCGTLQVAIFTFTGTRQTSRMRSKYFTAILRQEMAWYDAGATGELTARITGYVRRAGDARSTAGALG